MKRYFIISLKIFEYYHLIKFISKFFYTLIFFQGFDKAYVLFGQFLLLKKDKEMFIEWLKEEINASNNHATSTFNCLDEWAGHHI